MSKVSDSEAALERFIEYLNDLKNMDPEEIEAGGKSLLRIRSILIRMLYWLDRYFSASYFEQQAKKKEEVKRGVKRKR
jgi:hypothetical protein